MERGFQSEVSENQAPLPRSHLLTVVPNYRFPVCRCLYATKTRTPTDSPWVGTGKARQLQTSKVETKLVKLKSNQIGV
jgi:hypothetical protein